jgi:hypothetical protein
MDCRNFKEKLSEFLDRQLAGPDAALAETHMAQCRGCRNEFDELKGLSSMVSGLGHRALPVGFMQRLERRRRNGGQNAPAKSWLFLPPQARMAAFALSSLVVMFVVYDKAKEVLGPPEGLISGAADSLSETSSAVSAAKPTGFEGAASRGSGENAGGFGLSSLKKAVPAASFGAKQAYEPALAKASVTSTGQKLYKARGEPVAQDSLTLAGAAGGGGAGASFGSMAGGAVPAAAPAPEHAYTNEEIAADIETQKKSMGIRTIAPPPSEEQRRQMGVLAAMQGPRDPNALYLQARPSSPAISGDTPSLLSVSAVRGGSNTQARGQATLSSTDRLDEAPGVLIHSDAERQDLWHKYQITQNPPNVDYSTQMLAVVFATSNAAVQITNVLPGPDQVVVQYHELPAASATTDSAAPRSYQFTVIPQTDKPVVFQKLP